MGSAITSNAERLILVQGAFLPFLETALGSQLPYCISLKNLHNSGRSWAWQLDPNFFSSLQTCLEIPEFLRH